MRTLLKYCLLFLIVCNILSCKVNPTYNDIALFHQAIDNHDKETVLQYIGKFKHITNYELNYLNISSTHPVLESAIANDFEIMKIVTKHETALNYQDIEHGKFALQIAVKNNNKEMVQYLLHKGADPLLVDNYGQSILHEIALRNRNLDMAMLFQKNIKDLVNKPNIDGNTPFYQSLLEGDVGNGRIIPPNHDLVFFLINNGADFRYTFSKKYDVFQPLIERKENDYLVKLLSYYNGELPLSAYDNMDYVQLAIFCRNPEIVYLFLPKVRKNNPDTWGRTALHLAAYMDDLELIKLLIENGYDKTIIDGGGNTAYSIYVNNHKEKNKEIMELLDTK
jgi:ankyrin repeat protein